MHSAPQQQRTDDDLLFTRRFSASRRGARLARRAAAHRLSTWGVPEGSPLSDAVTLIVAELSANAALHGRVPGRDFEVRLWCGRAGGPVCVEVSDTHPAPPVCTPSQGDAEGGRGLLLVDALATHWEVVPRMGPGKTVRAVVDTATAVTAEARDRDASGEHGSAPWPPSRS
ncbi:ATP-binding protein [Streptomyces cacaoi]|uniref:ATP-binding protein n=1 Tax=Streptomyces cacaoi TaxID=1898 RepID=UPI002631B3FC|nr:ATP-binding protein [Streptomyces cacaoi]